MKADKKLIIAVLVGLAAIGFSYYLGQMNYPFLLIPAISRPNTPDSLPVASAHVFSDRAVVFSVSGPAGTFPVFEKELVVDPFTEVKTGDKQYFSVWVKDNEGIEKVSAKTKTDSEVFQFDLYLVEGDNKEGRWLGGWEIKDISPQKDYITELTAYSKTGEITTVGNSWKSAER